MIFYGKQILQKFGIGNKRRPTTILTIYSVLDLANKESQKYRSKSKSEGFLDLAHYFINPVTFAHLYN
jgi:hypothetical protein